MGGPEKTKELIKKTIFESVAWLLTGRIAPKKLKVLRGPQQTKEPTKKNIWRVLGGPQFNNEPTKTKFESVARPSTHQRTKKPIFECCEAIKKPKSFKNRNLRVVWGP